MDSATYVFQKGRTSLPVPNVFAYSSEVSPVGVEWILMKYMPGVELREAWKELEYVKKAQFAVDLIDLYHQLSQLRADSCGAVYHRCTDILSSLTYIIRSPRWKPLSSNSLQLL
jgi:hypothetical protein